MLCKNCKLELKAGETVCPNCLSAVPKENKVFENANEIKQALKSLVDSYGTDILADDRKFISFLNNYLPEYERERRLFKNIVNNDVVRNMLKEENHRISIMKTREYMVNELFIAEHAAEFVVDCFTYILGWDYVPSANDIPVPVAQFVAEPVKTNTAPVQKTQVKELRAFNALRYKLRSVVEIKEGFTHIDNFCFDGFGFLKAVKLPETVISIGEYAFSECKRLKTIDLPSGLRQIKNGAFSSCSKLNAIRLPYGICAVEDGVFSFCTSLESVELPSTLGSIGSEAFSGCEKLKSLYIPESVKFICDDAFSLCPNLTVRCAENSYVHKYCIDRSIPVVHPEV